MKYLPQFLVTTVIGLSVAVPFFSVTPVFASSEEVKKSNITALNSPKVQLVVNVEKKLVGTTSEGKNQVVWLSVGNKVKVCPGDTLRYQISSSDKVDLSAQNVVITQPIPPNMRYIPESAKSNNAKITYSIDQGKTFVAEPIIEKTLSDGTVVEVPAPVEMYTHIKWTYEHQIQRREDIQVSYDLQVR
jgi:uncharacterized repeat protein (TIGR01451 family)